MKTSRFIPQLATPADQQTVVNLVKEAADWLRDKGTDQWARPWPSLAERDERIGAGIAARATWIVWDGAVAVATITARRQGDPRLWHRDELDQPAAYAHRLVVNRDYAGRGIGADLLTWAGERAAAEYAARVTRIDVGTTNAALHRYYERIGFRFVRIADSGWDCPSLALFERPVPAARGARGRDADG
jgi:GNAT superfamily N-acetyltransferase